MKEYWSNMQGEEYKAKYDRFVKQVQQKQQQKKEAFTRNKNNYDNNINNNAA